MSALEAVAAVPTNTVALEPFFASRAADVDRGSSSVREGLAELGRLGLPEADIARSIEIVSAVAREDLATAFSAWAHRMTIDYVTASPAACAARGSLASLASAETLGSTALASGTAHVLAQAPLPVSYRVDGDDLVLDGRIPWASNLIEPFLVVSAAVNAEDPGQTRVVAIHGGAAGVTRAPHPELLALGATGSTTVTLTDVRISRDDVIAEDLHAFVSDVLPRFLLLQGAFCSGLANRSLAEAWTNLGPMGAAIQAELEEVTTEVEAADTAASGLAADALAGRPIETVELLRRRLRWSELATAAVHLEQVTTGGRGYLAGSATARRVREVAFLPIQAPTEVLLRWLLSRSK